MQRPSDERLGAYLDDALDAADRQQVEAVLATDPSLRDRLTALALTADLVRRAYAEVAAEPVPERLIAAARGRTAAPQQQAEIVVLKPSRAEAVPAALGRRWIGFAAAAGLFGLAIGGIGGHFGTGGLGPAATGPKTPLAAATNGWLDEAAGFYKLIVSAGDTLLVDVAASDNTREALQKISQNLPQQVRFPDLKPWGLVFRGARLVIVEGRPAAQLVYTTDNKAIGSLSLIIGSSQQPEIPPTFDHRQDVNLLYWRHQGRAYALVGETDIGYLWGIANDVAWQLDAI